MPKDKRARLAALPIGKKFRILEQMRERAVAIKAHKKLAIEKTRPSGKKADRNITTA
jgi:hypothetical protein